MTSSLSSVLRWERVSCGAVCVASLCAFACTSPDANDAENAPSANEQATDEALELLTQEQFAPSGQRDLAGLLSRAAVEYFELEKDDRECAAPTCGGYWLDAVNRRWMRCADGSWARTCYVAELTGEPVSSDSGVLVRGSIEDNEYEDFGNLGSLNVTEAWEAATTERARGIFLRSSSTEIECVTTPCFNVAAEVLNFGLTGRLSGYDLSNVGATDEQLDQALAAFTTDGLPASGRIRISRETTGFGLSLEATQFWLADALTSSECATDDDCSDAQWCRETESGEYSCVPFVGEGEGCNGFTLPWLYERCEPGLTCDTPDFIADAPGTCRTSCEDSSDCGDADYCATDGLCHEDATCDAALDCLSEGNEWTHILCVGYPTCSIDLDTSFECGWQCGDSNCIDLRGEDFGDCDAVLGYGVIFGECTEISGCSVDDSVTLFTSLEECQSACSD